MVFVVDIGDLFHRRVPQWFIHKSLDTFYVRNDITWQLLTKRPDRMYDEIEAWLTVNALNELPDWIWAGVTVENQDCAADRINPFSALRAAVRWVSYEPALGDIYWAGWEFVDWLVAGGESGADARPASVVWFRNARDWALENGIDFFFKQWGEWAPTGDNSMMLKRVGRYDAGCELDGREWREFPR
jgi:protein gp37